MDKIFKLVLEGTVGGVRNWIWLAALALLGTLAGTAIIIAKNRDRQLVEVAHDAGTGEAVIAGQQTTLQQNKDANDAEENLRRGGERSADRFQQCLLDTRRPAGCERFRPGQQQPVSD